MFDKAIIDTDRFMDMGISSKAMYFLLGMEADDEGFVSYRKVMRIHGGNEDDIKVLEAKRFIIKFQTGVVVITDWNKNNWLDSRRSRPTEYQEEKSKISLTKDNTYVLSTGLASIEENRSVESVVAQSATPSIFDLEKELQKLKKDKKRHIQLIGEYLEEKKVPLASYDEIQIAISRHCPAAIKLAKFTDDRIGWATGVAMKEYPAYTLETLVKILTR